MNEQSIERVDEISIIFHKIMEIGIQEHVDRFWPTHGNWQGLSYGQLAVLFMVYVIHSMNHRLSGMGILYTALLVLGCDVKVKEEGKMPDVDVKTENGQLPKYEVKQTQEGKLPSVDVDAESGKLPKVEVETPDVEVGKETVDVPVPDVDVKTQEKQINVPTVDIEMPEEEQNQGNKN